MLRLILSRPTTYLSPLSSSSSSSSRFISSSRPLLSKLSDGEALLKSKLEESLTGATVKVQDVSGGCGSFYAIQVEHESFRGLNTIKQHRMVNSILGDQIKGMHGLQALDPNTPNSELRIPRGYNTMRESTSIN
ncbi:hypothetical protein JCM5353_006165 [Sporobolomyces roseus]